MGEYAPPSDAIEAAVKAIWDDMTGRCGLDHCLLHCLPGVQEKIRDVWRAQMHAVAQATAQEVREAMAALCKNAEQDYNEKRKSAFYVAISNDLRAAASTAKDLRYSILSSAIDEVKMVARGADAHCEFVGGRWVAYYGPSILANGWPPHGQPSEAAYMPKSFDSFARVDLPGGGALLIENEVPQ